MRVMQQNDSLSQKDGDHDCQGRSPGLQTMHPGSRREGREE